MALTLPADAGEDEEPLLEDEDALLYVAKSLGESLVPTHHGVISVPEGEEVPVHPLVKALRERLHEKFDGTVFRDSVIPDPPERYTLGYGIIELIPGAEPQSQRPIPQQGVRRIAFDEIVLEWELHKKSGRWVWALEQPSFCIGKEGEEVAGGC